MTVPARTGPRHGARTSDRTDEPISQGAWTRRDKLESPARPQRRKLRTYRAVIVIPPVRARSAPSDTLPVVQQDSVVTGNDVWTSIDLVDGDGGDLRKEDGTVPVIATANAE